MPPPFSASVPRGTVIAFAAGFTAMMPIATDIYLIVMPEIARTFGASLAAVQASIAVFALGFGMAHLFVGVLADRYGRRPVAIGGVLLFLAATFAVVRAPSLDWLMICRFVQGLSIATCPILARAIIRDAVAPHEAGRAFAMNNAIAGLAPLIAPFAGAAAAAWGGWRFAMSVLLVVGAVLAVAVIWRLPETLQDSSDRASVSPLAAAGEILTHSGFLFGATISTLLYSALFTWLSTSPFLMIDTLGFSTVGAATVLGLSSGGYMLGSLFAARMATRLSPERMLRWGGVLMLAGSIGCLFALTRTVPTPWTVLTGVLPFYVGLGFAHANSIQIMMRPFAHIAGQASAWLGLIQQVGAVLISLTAVQLGAGLAAVGVMIACCAALLLAALVLPNVVARTMTKP